MKKIIASIFISLISTLGLLVVTERVASAAQKNFTSCSVLTPWETHFSVYYYNSIRNNTIYVRTQNGNLYAVSVTNDYLGLNAKGNQWRAVGTIPSATSLPSVAILTASEITQATCI